MKDENILNLIKSEEWQGRIGLNMSLINSYVIFHELNHAVQNLLQLEERAQYSEALKEVETRMICFYAAFLKADNETRKDCNKMREFLTKHYDKSNIYDLLPLTGDKIVIQFSDDKKPKSDEEIYSIMYKFFSGLNKENNEFNKIMAEYADWIKNNYGYTYNPDEFKPNYYLYNLIK